MHDASITPAERARARLRRDLTEAMRARDRVAVAALRLGLSALDQAEAVSADGQEARVGLARETARRELGDAEVQGIIRAEVEERGAGATELRAVDQAEAADRIDAERRVLEEHLDGPQPGAES